MSEQFTSVVGYEGTYEISRQGVVRSVLRTILRSNGTTQTFKSRSLSQFPDDHGYPCVHLRGGGSCGNRRVHVLLATAFIENPLNKPQVNHCDGNKSNYSLDNLEWSTDVENKQHAWRTGLRTRDHLPYKRGESIGNSKLTEAAVLKAKAMRVDGIPYSKIAKQLGVAKSTVVNAVVGRRWAHVS